MSTNSSIEWTATVHPDGSVTPGSTWNPVRGCTKVSPGCAHCYAETFAERFRGVKGHPYEQGFDLRLVPEKLIEPLSWKKPRRVFVNSMSDLFQEGVPFEFIDRVFAVMALAPSHTFQVLTKRPWRMREYFDKLGFEPERIDDAAGEVGACHANLDAPGRWPLPNVWLGVSVENQHFADERIPLLLQTPAAIRFISAEPLLGPINLSSTQMLLNIGGPFERGLDWVIVGGESGPKARPFDIAWARSIVKQCADAGVACFVKQLGARAYGPDTHSVILKSKKGGDPSEWPTDLQVRQFPTSNTRDSQR